MERRKARLILRLDDLPGVLAQLVGRQGLRIEANARGEQKRILADLVEAMVMLRQGR